MIRRIFGAASGAALLALAASLTASAARAETIYGIVDSTTTAGFSLASFDSANPTVVTTIAPITGLTAGQLLRGIDFRPATGQLYALSSAGATAQAQLYTIGLGNGVATPIGGALTLTGNTSARISLDFNPVVDRLRVVTGTGQNFRLNPNDGTIAGTDTTLTYAAGDTGTGVPFMGDIAYTNNVVGSTSTTLYAYDYGFDTLGTIGSIGGTPTSPNTGIVSTVGGIGGGLASFGADIGFDISGATGIGYVTFDENVSPTAATEFYTINLATGALTGNLTQNADLLDISVAPVAVAVPEPGTLALLGAGLLPVMGIVRRARRKAA